MDREGSDVFGCFGSIGSVDGLPSGTRVTASFGVTARTGNEGLEPLMRRADEALYKAKRNGRDSVRLSYERPMNGRKRCSLWNRSKPADHPALGPR